MASYEITVKTGNKPGEFPGTNARIFISIIGLKVVKDANSVITSAEVQKTEEQLLDDAPNFSDSDEKDYTIELPDVGTLKFLHIRHDNSGDKPGWFLDSVKIKKGGDAVVTFTCNNWLAMDIPDPTVARLLTAA